MYKYISLFIGIIIYLIYNHNETFNVGGKNIDESCENNQECNSDDGNCNDTCYCYFNKCKSIDSIGPDSDYNLGTHNVCSAGEGEDTYINMFSNSGGLFGRCKLNSGCEPAPETEDGRIDIEYNHCTSTYRGQPRIDCWRSHSVNVDRNDNLCLQSCPLKTKTNNSKDLVNAGFEHVQLVNLSDEIDDEYHNTLDYDVLSKYKGITVGEYHFYKFLEKKYNSRAKKIKNGIVYINSRIFYYTMADTVSRSMRGSDVNYLMFTRKTRHIIHKSNPEYLRGAFQILHVDFNNIRKWRSTWDENQVQSEQWGDSINKSLEFKNQTQLQIVGQMYNSVDNRSGDHSVYFDHFPDTDQLNLYKKLNKKLKHINIWVKLAGSQNLNSLALLDTVEDAKLLGNQFWPIQNWKNALLSQLSTDKNSPKKTRMNQFSEASGQIINLNNFDAPEYNVDLDNLYTFNMNDGDALVFNTLDTPHSALQLKNDEWRLSVETRYAYMNKPFDINEVFVMDSDRLIANVLYDNNNSLLVNEAQALSEIRPVGTAPTDYSPLIRGDGFFSIDIVKNNFL